MINIVRRRIPLLTEDKYEFVDLGLPSGLLWAKCNVGAETTYDYGLYFQWGDINGYTSDQVGMKYFGWKDYKYGNGTSSPGAEGMTKYNSTDGKTVLDLEDDAAHVFMGGKWRIPTYVEWAELERYTYIRWYSSYGSKVFGFSVISRINSNSIFLPAAGYCKDGRMALLDDAICYRSSSLSSVTYSYDPYVYKDYTNLIVNNPGPRYYGCVIRAVRTT